MIDIKPIAYTAAKKCSGELIRFDQQKCSSPNYAGNKINMVCLLWLTIQITKRYFEITIVHFSNAINIQYANLKKLMS